VVASEATGIGSCAALLQALMATIAARPAPRRDRERALRDRWDMRFSGREIATSIVLLVVIGPLGAVRTQPRA
jgi:hypothetical protein